MTQQYGVYVLSHGRPNNIKTIDTLRKHGYYGRVNILCDDEDETLGEYKRNFGQDVRVFSKKQYEGKFDIMDSGGNEHVVVYARNAIWDVAIADGYRHFVVLDDDYSAFQLRWDDGEKFRHKAIENLDEVFCLFFDFLDASKALAVCMTQGGDFIGGRSNKRVKERVLRKAMNVWFLDSGRKFEFSGRINEDTNAYVRIGGTGGLFMSVIDAECEQTTTQKSNGGLTEAYLDMGTYAKSFYSVMARPDCVKVAMMGESHMRMHHNIKWNNCCPKILSDRWVKRNG